MSTAEAKGLDITDDRQRGRYIAKQDGRFVGYTEYELEPGRIRFTHTVVKPEFEGQGIGSRLARHVVGDAVSRDLQITPVCPFVRTWLERHPEFDENVDLPTEP
ncbi:MAG TPA: GNAT family N-acetyltransferase [Candidatus Limnocylindrales bacterium]|nr:GNAT family N-acetyltransferase [Candidatus Limnocylindrales bacterium]